MNEQAEAKLSKRVSESYRQDRKVPLLINVNDGRLVPNNRNTAMLPAYRPYTGDPKASLDNRMRFLKSAVANARVRVVNSAPDREAVDIGKMSKAQLINFAMDEFGLVLSEEVNIMTLRKQVLAAAGGESAAAAALAAGKPVEDSLS